MPAVIDGFAGAVVGPEDERYDETRAVWNLMHDRRPALIARCATPADVAAAIRHAREHDLRIAIRGGGHSLPGHSTIDDGIVLDLRPMNRITIDPVQRRARVQAGALLGDVDRAAQEHGLVVPAGVVSHTGVAGLTLGGGVGRLMRRFGLTIDSLLSARVVLADGRAVRAADDENPELFWGLRGGGGNFGVVTEFEFTMHALGVLTALATYHPLDRVHEVLALGERTMADPATQDELLWTSFLRKGPGEAPWLAPEFVGVPGVMSLIEWSGDPAEGLARLAAIRRELDAPASDLAKVSFLEIQTLTDELLAPGTMHAYVKAGFTGALTDELIDVFAQRGAALGSPVSVIEVLAMGGAITRVAPDATAFAHRDARWLINIPGQWREAGETEREVAWVRDTFAAIEPHLSGGAYVNFMEGDEDQATDTAYGSTLRRLQAVKATYDPDNVFRLNQNIAPVPA